MENNVNLSIAIQYWYGFDLSFCDRYPYHCTCTHILRNGHLFTFACKTCSCCLEFEGNAKEKKLYVSKMSCIEVWDARGQLPCIEAWSAPRACCSSLLSSSMPAWGAVRGGAEGMGGSMCACLLCCERGRCHRRTDGRRMGVSWVWDSRGNELGCL